MWLLGFVLLFAIAYVLLTAALTWSLYRSMRQPTRFTYGLALARGFAVEPADLHLDARVVSLRDAHENTTIAWAIRGRAEDGPIVIMLHGFGRSRYSTLELAPALIDHANVLILPDLSGHGESEAPYSGAGATEHADVLAFIEQVRDGRRPIVLYGRSMGAGVAIAVAATEPDLVAGVIAEGAYRTWREPIRRRLRVRRYPVEPMLTLAGWLFGMCVAKLGSFDRATLAGRLRCPLLLLHGTDDGVCPIEDARAMAAAASNAQLVEFPGGMHLNLHQHDEARHRQAIAGFFAGLRLTADAGKMNGTPVHASSAATTEPAT